MTANYYNWKIFNAALIVSGISFFSKLFSAFKDLFVASIFGTGADVDIFILAALIPLMSVQILAVPYAAALVPEVTRLRVAGEEHAAFRIFERHLKTALLGLSLLALCLYVFASPVAILLAPLGQEYTLLTTHSLEILSALCLVAGLSQILVMILNAFERFALPAFSQILPPLGVIITLLLDPTSNATTIAWGALLGNGAQMVFLIAYYLSLRSGHSPSLTGDLKSYAVDGLWKNCSALLVSTLMMSSTEIVDQVMAARLGPGQVAVLGYGNKVVSVLISVVAGALGSAAFPYISQMIERREITLLAQTLRTYLRLILVSSLALVSVIVLTSDFIIEILFQRGAFSAIDTLQVSRVQQLAILQLPFYLINTLYMRVVMGYRMMGMLARITLVSILLNIMLNLLFSPYLGVAGIALSTTCVYIWSAISLIYLSRSVQNGYSS